MNRGVEILLSRMDSHPQEFCMEFNAHAHTKVYKWGSVLSVLLNDTHPAFKSFTAEEVQGIRDKYYSLQAEAFSEHVMKTLLKIEGSDGH